jgi:hypothetical protein
MVVMTPADGDIEKKTLSEMAAVGAGVGLGVVDALASDPPPPPPPQAARVNELAIVMEKAPSLNLEPDNNFIDGFNQEYGSINEIATS